jgi:hypothetical protein
MNRSPEYEVERRGNANKFLSAEDEKVDGLYFMEGTAILLLSLISVFREARNVRDFTYP